MSKEPCLLDQVRERIRLKRYSIRTGQAYPQRIRPHILCQGKRHLRDMGTRDVETFLSRLGVVRTVPSVTQHQAPKAILFLYREALGVELERLENANAAISSMILEL